MRRIIQFRQENYFRSPAWVVMAMLLSAFSLTIGCGPKEKVAKSQASKSAEKKSGTIAESADVDQPTAKASESVSLAADFPPLAPLPELPVPADNPLTDVKVSLGKLLFFDDRLSGDLGTSCASCHDPRMGWGDGNALSRGYAGTQHWRNSQTLVNTAYLSKLFWAGESPSLEAQADSAITGNLAGNGDPVMIEERLAQIPVYVDLFQEAFGIDRPTYEHVLKAIASFERKDLVSGSPLDEYLAGDQTALSEEAIRGKALFEGKAGCIQCHNGALLTDEKYHNLGLPEHPLFTKDPLRQVSLRYQHYIRGVPEEVYRTAKTDLGLYYTTKRKSDIGRFRTPPLRYISYTAPYMHNGVFESLEEVIEFYDAGGGDHPGKSPLLKPLNLTEDEKWDLLEFLESMSGDEIRMTPPELPPYEPTKVAAFSKLSNSIAHRQPNVAVFSELGSSTAHRQPTKVAAFSELGNSIAHRQPTNVAAFSELGSSTAHRKPTKVAVFSELGNSIAHRQPTTDENP